MVGDAIGMKWTDDFIVSNPNSQFWNEADYLQSIDTLKALNVKTIGLSHFGCLTGDEAGNFLDDSVATYWKWMDVFAQNADRIDDISYLVEIIWANVYHHMPDNFKALRVRTWEPCHAAIGVPERTYLRERKKMRLGFGFSACRRRTRHWKPIAVWHRHHPARPPVGCKNNRYSLECSVATQPKSLL